MNFNLCCITGKYNKEIGYSAGELPPPSIPEMTPEKATVVVGAEHAEVIHVDNATQPYVHRKNV